MSQVVARKLQLVNNVTFPRELRDAIPDHRPSAGRCLKLDSVDAQAAHTVEWGRRVQIKLRVCETGKLSGQFDVWVDVQIDAAKALIELIQGAVEQAEKNPAGAGLAGDLVWAQHRSSKARV
jgi:hypothetical protein